jgi:SWI/SNF-related matrix-associated actin-dependent regulator of chromatin subfamily A member 5
LLLVLAKLAVKQEPCDYLFYYHYHRSSLSLSLTIIIITHHLSISISTNHHHHHHHHRPSKQLAARWRTLTPDTKAVYLEQEAVDRARFNEASAAADAEVLAEQEARRTLLTVQQGEQAGSRGARARMDQERAVREEDQAVRRQRLEDDMDPEEAAERARAVETKRNETAARRQKKKAAEEAVAVQHKKLDKEDAKKATQRLEYLLQQSSIFAKLSGGAGSIPTQKSDATEKDNGESGKKDKRQRKPSATAKEAGKAGVHHIHTEDDDDDDVADGENENEEEEETPIFLTQQPSSIKFGNLKPYQLEALNWMIHLAGKGLNGILADEMGLGKTLQSISILAYHHEFLKIQGPHLICVPKSTLSNWMNELKRWCPVLRVIKFHGSREDREYMVDNMFTNAAAAHDGKRPDKPQIMDEKGELVDDNSDNPRTWDVCVTTYEVANNESKTLLKFAWKYLIIDEAHRLKNDASLFSKTVRSFRTANRLLLTGYVTFFMIMVDGYEYGWSRV